MGGPRAHAKLGKVIAADPLVTAFVGERIIAELLSERDLYRGNVLLVDVNRMATVVVRSIFPIQVAHLRLGAASESNPTRHELLCSSLSKTKS